MACTRHDITHSIGIVSKFLSNIGREHCNAIKWITRYLRGTSSLRLGFENGQPLLVGYIDVDMAGDMNTRKSTLGYLITFASGAVAWQLELQKSISMSTTEAEFIAATKVTKELL